MYPEEPLIVAQGIGKNYGAFEAIADVSFSIDTGDIVGFLGPNGAGKTTILRILTGYHLPSKGDVHINSLDVYEDLQQIKKTVGYLPENVPLYSDLSVKEYLNFIAGARGMAGKEKRINMERVVAECGLEEVFERSIDRISKGYRQRVGFAQAIIHNPPVLILDEPTNGLDPNQIIEFRELIKRLGREKTVILSTHILQEAETICNSVLILNKGTIVGQGTAESIERELRGETSIALTLKAGNDLNFNQALTRIPSLRRIKRRECLSDGNISLTIALEPDVDGGEILFDWAIAEQVKILSMQQERFNLEDIFVQLTGESDDRNA